MQTPGAGEQGLGHWAGWIDHNELSSSHFKTIFELGLYSNIFQEYLWKNTLVLQMPGQSYFGERTSS